MHAPLTRCGILLASVLTTYASAQMKLETFDVTWKTPSQDAAGSMPIGNGEVGANVWVEPNGDLLILVSRTDSWSEASRLLKLGRVRVKMDPSPFKPGDHFRQRLNLRDGRIELEIGKARLELFIDSERPVIWLSGKCGVPTSVKAELEIWRKEKRELKGGDLDASWTMKNSPKPVFESGDMHTIGAVDYMAGTQMQRKPPPAFEAVLHRNEWSIFSDTLAHQGLSTLTESLHDPLLKRTFGLLVQKYRYRGQEAKRTLPVGEFLVQIIAHGAIEPDRSSWIFRSREEGAASPWIVARERTAKWWRAFWDRSYIFVNGDRAGLEVPKNRMPIRIGFDSAGGNRFQGEIRQSSIVPIVLSEQDLLAVAKQPGAQSEELRELPTKPNLTDGFTCHAWIKPTGPVGRIFDNLTAGQSDGFLFDTHPGYSLRAIVGSTTVTSPKVLTEGKWSHVALTVDPKSGRIQIFLDGKVVAQNQQDDVPSRITQKTILQRWVTACGGRGNYPIKFNGSIFTVEPKALGESYDPDWRRWGDCFWWQNTRLPYAPMLASGDFEMLEPLFRTYLAALPLAKARTALYHGAKGAYFPETMTFFGTYSNNDYGWDRTGLKPSDVQCPWWQWAWNQGPELLMLMLDRYAYKPEKKFATEVIAPMAGAVLDYFDSRFPRDDQGRLKLTPTQSVETYWYEVINDTPTVAGLHAILPRLIEVAKVSPISGWPVAKLADFRAKLPSVPTKNGKIAPAESYRDQRSNVENPELYAIWPFRLYGVGQPDLALAQKTFRERIERANAGWQYDGQVAALCGLTLDAKQTLLSKVSNSNPAYRWPATWGPNYDWLPDQCHGGNLVLTLQTMLLQEANGKLYVLPAWPKEWDVSFKLWASGGTRVSVEYRKGKIVSVNVEPRSRARDLVLPQ